jgi:hypothetical protein
MKTKQRAAGIPQRIPRDAGRTPNDKQGVTLTDTGILDGSRCIPPGSGRVQELRLVDRYLLKFNKKNFRERSINCNPRFLINWKGHKINISWIYVF